MEAKAAAAVPRATTKRRMVASVSILPAGSGPDVTKAKVGASSSSAPPVAIAPNTVLSAKRRAMSPEDVDADGATEGIDRYELRLGVGKYQVGMKFDTLNDARAALAVQGELLLFICDLMEGSRSISNRSHQVAYRGENHTGGRIKCDVRFD